MLLLSINLNIWARDNSKLHIYLITCSAGEELYTAYGHSAVRLCDSIRGLDIVFNYGTFDFDTPYFYLKFLNGELDYMLSTSSYSRFVRSYAREGRGVVEREIILSTEERVELANLLIENSKPENKYYRYDFFFDNCATRIRDLVFRVKGIETDSLALAFTDMTYRDCIHQFVGPNEWCGQGIDLILGVETDYRVSNYQKAMLPYFLEELFLENNVASEEGIETLERTAFADDSEVVKGLTSPVAVGIYIVLATLVVSRMERKRGRWIRGFDVGFMVIMSIVSVLLWYLWIVSEIRITSNNMNVLWASIVYVPLVVMICRKGSGAWMRRLAMINILLIGVFALVVILGVQYCSPLALAICISLFIRNLLIVRRNTEMQ